MPVPVLTVFGVPHQLKDNSALRDFSLRDLPAAVVRASPEMGITTDLVTVFVPDDLLSENLGTKIVVFIEGLLMRYDRTPVARQLLADGVRDCVRDFALKHAPACRMIEVIPRSQRPDDGFAVWRRDA